MKTALLIPAYKPKKNTLPFLKSFQGNEFDYFVVVDDGSGKEYEAVFAAIESETPFLVISYPVNRGKGAALKEGIAYLSSLIDAPNFIITADCDGQHLYEDILRLRDEAKSNKDAFILGMREFDTPDVPARSSAGNRLASFHVWMLTGVKLVDTQTGLRSIPSCLYPLALAIKGNRYDYEFSFLISAMKEAELRTITIQTVYENNNEGSHYRAVVDSLRISKNSLVRVGLSLAYFAIDVLLFALFYRIMPAPLNAGIIAISGVLARVISASLYASGIAFLATPNRLKVSSNALNCLIVSGVMGLLSIGLIYLFSLLFQQTILIKLFVDLSLLIVAFFANRVIQNQQGRYKYERKVTDSVSSRIANS
ncbi:MAG: glycosyltransferase family 2 protein [Bacilli bacterium]|nr:glycosyltransferase family 2 protein [Bacilli bacterium]